MIASGAISDSAPINESVTLDAKTPGQYELLNDAPVSVAFGGVVDANVVVIFSDRPITVTLTSTAGAASVVCDDMVFIISRTTPYTAITLTRTPATDTNVTVFLGEKA